MSWAWPVLGLALWLWLLRSTFHTKARCQDCRQRKVPIIGPWFGARRRVCIYCADCAPEYYQ